MRCPACGHERPASLLRCSTCGRTFPRSALEHFDQLTFLLAEIAVWADRGLIAEPLRRTLESTYRSELQELRDVLGVEAAPTPGLEAEPVGAPTTSTEVQVAPQAPEPGRVPVTRRPAAASAVSQKPAPLTIRRPQISWEIIGRTLLSPRSLEALLYVGAFLIVAAAGTFVYFNWGRFSPTLQLLFLMTGTAVFFIAGWSLRTRWRLIQSGTAFIAIGTLIIPVDFYAWVRFRDLPPEASAGIWLVASACCTVAYAATAWWIRHRFFLVISQVAAHSLLLSVLRLAEIPIDWWGAPTVLLATGWVVMEPFFDHAGPGLRQAAVTSAIVFAASGLLAPALLHWDEWAALTTSTALSGRWLLAVAGSWWMGSVFLAALSRHHRPTLTAHATMVAVPVAAIMTLLPVMSRAWISLPLLGLAAVFVAAREWRADPLTDAAFEMGIVLSVVALVWAAPNPFAVTATYLAGAVLYAWWAWRLDRSVLVLVAQGVGLAGLLTLLGALHVGPQLWPLVVLAAGAGSLAIAAIVRRPASAQFLYLGAYAQVLMASAAALVVSARAVQVTLLVGSIAVAIYSAARSHAHTDAALNTLIDRWVGRGIPVFQWAAAVLVAADLALAWTWWRPVPRGLAAAALVLSSIYVLLGRALRRVEPAYAKPWTLAGFGGSVAAMVLALALQNRWEVIGTLALAGATYAIWAWVVAEPRFAHLSAWLLLVPVMLSLPALRASQFVPSRQAYAWVWAGLAAAYLLVGATIDRRAPPFAVGYHLVSHLLVPLALLWSLPDRTTALWTLAVSILFYAASAWLADRGHHPSFLAAMARIGSVAPEAIGAGRGLFVYAASWLFPFWFYLAVYHLPSIAQVHARLGVAMAMLAWAYLGLGQVVGARDPAYRPPFWIAAQALAVVGGLLAADQRPVAIATLAIGVGAQVALYRLSGQVLWVSTAALGGGGLLGLILAQLGVSAVHAGWTMIVLAAGYLGLAEISWRRMAQEEIPPASAALYAVAFVATAVGLLLSSFRAPLDTAVAYAAGALVLAWAGWRLREPLLGYGVAGLVAAAYVAVLVTVARTRSILAPPYGLWLAPGIVAFFAAGYVLERFSATARSALLHRSWAGPCYVAAHVGTAAMMVYSAAQLPRFPLALTLGTVAYGTSASLFRSPAWLYPALLAAHGAAFFGLLRTAVPPSLIPLAFVPVAVGLALAGQRLAPMQAPRSLAAFTWAQPFSVMALANVALWELVSFINAPAHIVVSVTFAILAGLFAHWWQDDRAASLSLALVTIGVAETLRWQAVSYPVVLLTFSLLALVLGGMEVTMRSLRRGALWQPGASMLAFIISASAVVVAVAGVVIGIHGQAGAGLVYTLAIVGLLYLLYAIVRQWTWLGYLAVAMLEAAWGIFLLRGLQVREIQWYAVPAALYLLGVGAIERRRGHRSFAQVVDIAGLALLLGSSLWQSVGPEGFGYAIVLAIEALLVTWFGAAQRLRRHFFGGLGALVVNVVVQAINPLRALDKTVLFLSLGVLLVAIAILAERKREDIIRTTRDWWSRLEAWE